MMSAAYTAPASKVLTVLHIKDLEIPASQEPEPSDGQTRCGLPMLYVDLWLAVGEMEGIPVCGRGRGIGDEQEALC